jgi:phage/plasmid-associated DNA primase
LRKTEKYQHDNDDVARFIDDECLTEARAGTKVSAWATTQELYNRYTPWWRAECSADPRKRMLGRKQFGMELDRLGYEVREGNRKPRVGIRLRPEPEGRNVLVRRSF